MKKIIIDLENKDEGPLHSFVKQMIYYQLISYKGEWRVDWPGEKHERKRFWGNLSTWSNGLHIMEKECVLNCYTPEKLKKIVDEGDKIWMERTGSYGGKTRIPDLSILNEKKLPENVIEIIDSNSINFDKIVNYFNENVNIVCIFVDTPVKSLEGFYNLNYFSIKADEYRHIKIAKAIKLFFKFKGWYGDCKILIRNHRKKGYMLYHKRENKKWRPYSGTLKKTETSKDRNKQLESLCSAYVSEVKKIDRKDFRFSSVKSQLGKNKEEYWELPV